MRLRYCLLASTIVACALAQPAVSAPWTRGFVVRDYGFAFRYGGRPGVAETAPAADCARGSATHFNDEAEMRTALSRQPWRSSREIEAIIAPPGIEKARLPTYVRFYVWGRAVSYRGWRKGIETYVNPFAAHDPGQPQVVSRISDGFDLDGNPKTGGFTSAEGVRGIDNALYRAWGCDAPFRNPASGTLDLRENTQMQEGLYTVVIRISGNQDPRNDSDATVEIGYSPDKIVRDARANVAPDYSYRIVKSEQYTRLKAKIRNGVVETEQVDRLHVPRIGWFPDQMGDADFHKGRLSLTIAADGRAASGFVGGYRKWLDLLAENTFAQTGAEQGIRDHEDAVGLYYALKRNADGMTDPKTGHNTGISMAYRIAAVPAHVVDPAKPAQVRRLPADEERNKGFETVKAAMIRAVTTRTVQDVPLGTGEGQFPAMEKTIADLPSRDFFLKTFDAPGRLDDQGNVVPLAPDAKPDRQVNINGPATVASGNAR
ncbi:MAG: hypothetical protein H0U98_14055 [Alphaproteobacteria bacterium]|nr:hypothetical protein [Alphaproteobacteria bacterium]